ncbi:MAG: nuclear transport factor 2 family protein [Dehalococcoidia bacterium]
MSNATTSNATATVDTYIAMWNETDPTKRAELIERAWASDGRYLDPQLEADGAAAISGMVAAVHERFPGHRFRRVSGVDQHHDQIRFGWELFAPDGSVTVGGIDIGELTADGRLRRITGFFGPLPEETAA